MRLILIILLAIVGCGAEPKQKEVKEPPYCSYYANGICIHEPDSSDRTSCSYYLNDVCIVKDSRFMEIDVETLVWTFFVTETHFNTFYPGLDLFALAAEKGLRIRFHWSDYGTSYGGTYADLPTGPMIHIYLRRGDNITSRMECIDKYFTTSHELMHFAVRHHVGATKLEGDGHSTPHVFIGWELRESIAENREYDQTNIAEGLAYSDVSNDCGY